MLNSNLQIKWYNFGKYIRIVAIFCILLMVPYFSFAAIGVQFIFICIALAQIKIINRQLKNRNLDIFFSKYVAASILKLIGLIIVNIAGVMIAGIYLFGFIDDFFYYYGIFPFNISLIIRPITIIFIVGFIFMIIGCSIEKGAWENLKIFLEENSEKIPANIYLEVREGVDKLSKAAFLWAIGFLIIPIFIGWIFYIIGYFKLASFNNWIPGIEKQPVYAPKPKSLPNSKPQSPLVSESNPSLASESKHTIKYCPNCGSEVEEIGRYCGFCGTAL